MTAPARTVGLNVGECAFLRLFCPSKPTGMAFDIRERGANRDGRRTLRVITDDDLRGIADSLAVKGLMDKRGEWNYSFTELGQSAWAAMMGERGAAMARVGGARHGSKDGR